MAYRYLTRKINGKTKLLHRHVMEQHLGRALLPSEHVHHKFGRRENDPSALEVLDRAEHLAHHAAERRKHPLQKQCTVCGAVFIPHPTKRARAKTCSQPCANQQRSRTERATKQAIVEANFVADVEREAA